MFGKSAMQYDASQHSQYKKKYITNTRKLSQIFLLLITLHSTFLNRIVVLKKK